MIKENKSWIFCGGYIDEGISGTSVNNRKDFLRMIEDAGNGKIDLICGTHRLFSNDVKFKDLGLLILDEEQRFGVKAKEKLKQIKL